MCIASDLIFLQILERGPLNLEERRANLLHVPGAHTQSHTHGPHQCPRNLERHGQTQAITPFMSATAEKESSSNTSTGRVFLACTRKSSACNKAKITPGARETPIHVITWLTFALESNSARSKGNAAQHSTAQGVAYMRSCSI